MATNYINSPLIFVLVPPVIFEMTTFRSSGECSYHVSYRGIIWYPQNDLNVHCWFRRPGVYPLAYKGIFGVPRGNRTLMPKRQSLNLMCMPVSPPGHMFGWDGWIQTNEMRQSKCRALSLGYISIWSGIEDLNLCPSAPKADAIPSYANSGGFDVTCRLHQPEWWIFLLPPPHSRKNKSTLPGFYRLTAPYAGGSKVSSTAMHQLFPNVANN